MWEREKVSLISLLVLIFVSDLQTERYLTTAVFSLVQGVVVKGLQLLPTMPLLLLPLLVGKTAGQ